MITGGVILILLGLFLDVGILWTVGGALLTAIIGRRTRVDGEQLGITEPRAGCTVAASASPTPPADRCA